MSLEDLTNMKAEYEAKMKKEGEKALKDHLNKFLDEHPEIEALRWEQYTPHFNDGDACLFSMNDISVQLASNAVGATSDEKTTDDDDDDDGNFIESYELDKKHSKIAEAVEELHSELEEVEDILQEVLGDHSRITVTRDKIDVEEYDHD